MTIRHRSLNHTPAPPTQQPSLNTPPLPHSLSNVKKCLPCWESNMVSSGDPTTVNIMFVQHQFTLFPQKADHRISWFHVNNVRIMEKNGTDLSSGQILYASAASCLPVLEVISSVFLILKQIPQAFVKMPRGHIFPQPNETPEEESKPNAFEYFEIPSLKWYWR